MVSKRYCRFASRVERFRGWPVRVWSSRCVGGSLATPTQCGLIAEGRMPINRSSTVWPNGYVHQRPEGSGEFLFKKRDLMRELQRAIP